MRRCGGDGIGAVLCVALPVGGVDGRAGAGSMPPLAGVGHDAKIREPHVGGVVEGFVLHIGVVEEFVLHIGVVEGFVPGTHLGLGVVGDECGVREKKEVVQER